MDPKLDEILQLTRETNRMVHKMRRAQLWGRFYQVVWWLFILAISGITYYYYFQPYVDKILEAYGHIQATGQQAQNYGSEISNFFGNFIPHQGTTTPQ